MSGRYIRSLMNPVDNFRIDPVEPWTVELASLVSQAVDGSGPVEAGRTIVSIIGIWQIHLGCYLPVRKLYPRKINRETWYRTDKEAQKQSGRKTRNCHNICRGFTNLEISNYSHAVYSSNI